MSRGLPYAAKMRAAPPSDRVRSPTADAALREPAASSARLLTSLTRTVYEPLRTQTATGPLPKTRWYVPPWSTVLISGH